MKMYVLYMFMAIILLDKIPEEVFNRSSAKRITPLSVSE